MSHGLCQTDTDHGKANHVVTFNGQPRDPMYVCDDCAARYRRDGHRVRPV